MSESFIARVARGIGTAWFGPQAPLPPAAPSEVAGRQFDYPFGFNLAVTPRGNERTGFAELRGLADASDLVRLAVETRKDQIERLSWRIRPRGIGGDSADDPRIAALTDFFARPDRRNGWHAWLRLLLEDLLVIDAPTLYRRRNRLGGLWALEVLDGSTIKRLIDDWGRTPAPPSPAYQQILKGIPAVDYDVTELIYAPRNARVHKAYGFSPVEQVQMAVNIALRRQIYQLQYYTEGNIPEALIGVPESWNPDQIRQFQSYWDSLHLGDTAERRHAKFVPGGVAKTFVPVREPAMKDAFDEWLARIVCYAFSLPPTAFTGQVNRATAETVQDVAVSEGLVPLQNWVKQLIDGVIAEDFGAPDLEFAWDADRDIDPAATASIAVSYVQAGIKTVDEVRAELGLPPMKGGPAGPSVVEKATAAEVLRRYNSDHYGPGDRGGEFAPKGEGDVQVASNGPATNAAIAKPKPWENQPHSALRQKIAEEEQSADKENDGYGQRNAGSNALGRYQMTLIALQAAQWKDSQGNWLPSTGIKSDQDFLKNPEAQERAMTDYLNDLDSQIKRLGLASEAGLKYQGKSGEITVTEAGLVAASHREGAPAVRTYFRALHNNGDKTNTLKMNAQQLHIETRLREFQNVEY